MATIASLTELPESLPDQIQVTSSQLEAPPDAALAPGAPKKYHCPHCRQTFSRLHNLKSHLLIHSQEKKFTCETCSSKFRRIHDLKRHLKLHTGERPYLCRKCGRRFARGDALVRHTKASVTCSVAFVSLEASRIDGEEEDREEEESSYTYSQTDQYSTKALSVQGVSQQQFDGPQDLSQQRALVSSNGSQAQLPSIMNSSSRTDQDDQHTHGIFKLVNRHDSLSLPPISASQNGTTYRVPTHHTNSLYGTPTQTSPTSQYPSILKGYGNPVTHNGNNEIHEDVDGIAQESGTAGSNIDKGIDSAGHHPPHSSSAITTVSASTILAPFTHHPVMAPSSSSSSSSTNTPVRRPSEPTSLPGSTSNLPAYFSSRENDESGLYSGSQITSAPAASKWNNAGNSVANEPWRLIRVLESRVRALEERLNSAEGRVVFLEGQFSSLR